MNRKLTIVLFAVVVVLIFAVELFLPRTVEIDLSGEGVRYASTDASVAESMPLTFRGKIRGARIGDSRFSGTIDIPSLWAELPEGFGFVPEEIHYAAVEIAAKPQFGPLNTMFHHTSGYVFTPVNYTVMPKNGAYAIILPWSAYRVDGDNVGASFYGDDFTFICVGDITRDEAVEVLKGIYQFPDL